jgi:hypothetical protein
VTHTLSCDLIRAINSDSMAQDGEGWGSGGNKRHGWAVWGVVAEESSGDAPVVQGSPRVAWEGEDLTMNSFWRWCGAGRSGFTR